MDVAAKILIRRMGTKTEEFSKGFLRGRETKVSLDGTLATEEQLCLVSNDGEKAEVVTLEDIPVLCGERQALAAGDMLFAVFRPPFSFRMSITAGNDADGFLWLFEVEGRLEIRKPASFARTFRGEVVKEKPLTAPVFEEMLMRETIAETTLHDKILVDVLGVMSLGERDGEDRYVDMQGRLNQERGVGEKYVASAVAEAFDEYFGEEGVVALKVTSFRARSPECEMEIAKRKDWLKQQELEATLKEIEAQEKRIAAEQAEAERAHRVRDEADRRKKELEDEKHKTDLARLQAERERIKAEEVQVAEKRRREAEVAARKHEVELAELEAQKKKLEKGGESAFEALEMLSNALGNAVAQNGAGTLAGLLQEARRTEAGLKVIALSKDRKRRGGGVKFQKLKRTRGLVMTSVLHCGETLASAIESGRGGFLTLLNVSETNEIVPMLPNGDFPDVRISRGGRILVGDDASEYIPEIHESASSGTDHLVAIVSDRPLLDGPLAYPDDVGPLSGPEASRLVAKLASMDDSEWAADVLSFHILP